MAPKTNVARFSSENPLRRVMEALKELKDKEAYKKILQNLVIVNASADRLPDKLKDYIGNDAAKVFIFARSDEGTRDRLRSIEGKASSIYIDEREFSRGAYYPLAEIVALALAQHFETIVADGKVVNSLVIDDKIFDLSKINIKAISNDGAALIISLLPAAQEHDAQDLVKRYAAMLSLLEAA